MAAGGIISSPVWYEPIKGGFEDVCWFDEMEEEGAITVGCKRGCKLVWGRLLINVFLFRLEQQQQQTINKTTNATKTKITNIGMIIAIFSMASSTSSSLQRVSVHVLFSRSSRNWHKD